MKVLKGDIGFVNNGTRNTKTNQPLAADHSFLITEDGDLSGNTPTVHLTYGGMEVWPVKDQFAQYICRCPDLGLAAQACKYASSWASSVPSKTRNTYNSNRAKAVMHDVGSGGDLKFDFDALRRAFKWQRRLDAPFSTNKGLSCAAWVAASYQAASLSDASIELGALERGWKLLEELRNPKKKEKERAAVLFSEANYREHVNVGAKALDAMAQVLALLKREKHEPDAALLTRLFTDVMLVDARFLHSDGLFRRIKADQKWKVFEIKKDFDL